MLKLAGREWNKAITIGTEGAPLEQWPVGRSWWPYVPSPQALRQIFLDILSDFFQRQLPQTWFDRFSTDNGEKQVFCSPLKTNTIWGREWTFIWATADFISFLDSWKLLTTWYFFVCRTLGFFYSYQKISTAIYLDLQTAVYKLYNDGWNFPNYSPISNRTIILPMRNEVAVCSYYDQDGGNMGFRTLRWGRNQDVNKGVAVIIGHEIDS